MGRVGALVATLALALASVSLVPAPAAAASAGATGASPAAGALVPEPPRPGFYEAPATLPAHSGDVIRQEKVRFFADHADFASLTQDARRILYRSTARNGKPVAVSGTVIVPSRAWRGTGPRPVIAYAPGTQGMADRCAPSRLFSELVEYEGLVMQGLLQRGYAIVMTDYEGLGTAGVHTYMDRVSQGRAVLDSARAIARVGIAGITSANPVGLQGYSQGGGATASAAELAASYAPELKVVGAVAGAVPADLARVATSLDGGLFSAFGFFALRGLSASYGLDLDPYLNARGQQVMRDVENDCVFDLFSHAFVRSSTLSASGQPISRLMQSEPFASVIAEQRLGRTAPKVPVLLTHSALDDTIPYGIGHCA